MEITQKSATTAPSWLSIVTKASRFSSADVQGGQGNNNSQSLGTNPVQQSRQNGYSNKSKVKCKQSNGEESTSKSDSDQEISSKIPCTQQQPPKKYNKRQRAERSIISRSSSELDYQHKVKIELITAPPPHSNSNSILTLSSNHPHSSSSTSSSPSPGLLSCGSSASSAEDDLSSVSTSTSTLSAFSNSSSPSPKPFLSNNIQMGFVDSSVVPNDFDEENSHHYPRHYPGIKSAHAELGSCYINFHSLHPNNFINLGSSTTPNLPPSSNRISVIRSTSSYFQNVQYCEEEGGEEEPQDLSVKKPKRSTTTTTTTSSYNVSNLKNDEYQCVQDLSVRPSSTSTIFNNNNNDRTHKPRPTKLVKTAPVVICSVESTPIISSPSSSSPSSSKPLLEREVVEIKVEKVEAEKCSSSPPIIISAYCHKLKYGRTDDNEGELIIADISPEKKFDKKHVKVDLVGKNETINKIHKTTTEEKVKESITKESYRAVETEVIKLKSRRGRKRKDEETPGTFTI
jgi:hypothetical protein